LDESRMSRYFTAFILPSTLHNVPTPYHVMHPQIITDTFLWYGGHMHLTQKQNI
jgi:hypothetical protein